MPMKALMLVFLTAAGCYMAKTAAAQAPAMHVGTFEMDAPAHCGGQTWCGLVGRGAMSRAGFNVTRSSDYLAFGIGNNATIAVICTPVGNTSWAAVVAASPDSATAERYRNSIRQDMQTTGCL
jgi:hypothetical protein